MRAFFGNSLPGFEPMTLKSLLKSTCAGHGHFEQLLSPLPAPLKQKKGYNFFSSIPFDPWSSKGSALRSFICTYQLFPRKVCWKIVAAHFRWLYYVNFGRTLNFHSGSWVRILAGNFQKFALIPRISNYVYIQALGHKKQCCKGLCKSIWSFI